MVLKRLSRKLQGVLKKKYRETFLHFFSNFTEVSRNQEIKKICDKMLTSAKFQTFFCKRDPFNDVQLWSKFYVNTVSQIAELFKKTSFAYVSIFWFLCNIFFWRQN